MQDAAAPRGRKPRAREEKYCRHGHLMEYVDSRGRICCQVCKSIWARTMREARRQERLKERRRRLAERSKPPKKDRMWAAGHFEGEGTITILSDSRGNPPRPHVSLVSTDKSVIDFFHARWPGPRRSFIPKSATGRARRAYRWVLSTSDAVEGFLLDILPHLQTDRVRVKADLLLEDVRERTECRRTKAVRERRFARMARMRELNRRGVDRPRMEEDVG